MTRRIGILSMPNAEMEELHDCMPVILEQRDWPLWLGEAEGDHAALMRPAGDGLLLVWLSTAAQQRTGAVDGHRGIGAVRALLQRG